MHLRLGSATQSELAPPAATGAVLLRPPGRLGPPPPSPLDEIRWFHFDGVGLIVGRTFGAANVPDVVASEFELITVETFRHGESFIYGGVDWATARRRAGFMQAEWNTNYFAVAGLVELNESITVQEVMEQFPGGATMDDVDALAANVLASGVSTLGVIERVFFGPDRVTLVWSDFRSCERTTVEFEPIFALLPEEESTPESAVIIYEFDDQLCSIAFQSSDRRLTFTIEEGCTAHPSIEMNLYSGGLAPTRVPAYPPLYSCDD